MILLYFTTVLVNHTNKIIHAYLFVRKLTLNVAQFCRWVNFTINSSVLCWLGNQNQKTFLASTGLQIRRQEDVFSRKPIQRPAVCFNTNEAFLGSKKLNPFHFRKFNMVEICLFCNVLPVAESHINTTDAKRLYFNTMSDLAYIDNGHGISLFVYPYDLTMVFDPSSTQ